MKIKDFFTKEEGQSLVLAAIAMVVLLGFVGLVVDVGQIYTTKSKLQKAVDASALAAAQELPHFRSAKSKAVVYSGKNGFRASEETVTTPYKGNSSKIEVVGKKTVDFTFARVLGFTKTVVSARAVAQKTGTDGGPFNYAVFSGSPNFNLRLNGSNTYIRGSAHSNDQFSINGSNQKITGSAEAVYSFRMNGSNQTINGAIQARFISLNGSHHEIGNKIYSAAPVIDMPDFSDVIQSEAEAAGQVYVGNKRFNGSNINVDSPIYVKGDVKINGSHFTGKGIVLATGDITFNGSNLSASGASVCFYSENGDITINGANARLDGIVYAPNGEIRMNGSNQTINGRIIGYKVDLNGSNYKITSSPSDLESLPKREVKLVE